VFAQAPANLAIVFSEFTDKNLRDLVSGRLNSASHAASNEIVTIGIDIFTLTQFYTAGSVFSNEGHNYYGVLDMTYSVAKSVDLAIEA
jgi:hypothetical protein